MKLKRTIFIWSTILFFVGAGFATFSIVQESLEFSKNREIYTETVVLTEGILDPISWLPNGSWEAKVNRAEVFKNRSNRAYDRLVLFTYYVICAAVFYIVLTLVLFYRKVLIWRYLSACLMIISIFALVIGISTPMMEMAAFNTDLTIPIDGQGMKGTVPNIGGVLDLIDFDVTFDGRMYYFYQSKSILGLTRILFLNGNIPVGASIGLFSVVLPVLKLILSFLQLANKRFGRAPFVRFVLDYLGKWSMADVFVVALFLGYFSLANISTGVESESSALLGLYCFGSYVIISLLSSQFAKHGLKKEEEHLKLSSENEV